MKRENLIPLHWLWRGPSDCLFHRNGMEVMVMVRTSKTRLEEASQLPPKCLGILALGTPSLGTEQPCWEKPKPHGETSVGTKAAATPPEFPGDRRVSEPPCRASPVTSSADCSPVWNLIIIALETPDENCPAEPSQPTKPWEVTGNHCRKPLHWAVVYSAARNNHKTSSFGDIAFIFTEEMVRYLGFPN